MTFYDHHQSLLIPPRNLRHENICITVKNCLAFNLQRRIKIRLKKKLYNTFILFRTFVHQIYYRTEQNQMPVSWKTILIQCENLILLLAALNNSTLKRWAWFLEVCFAHEKCLVANFMRFSEQFTHFCITKLD